MMTRIGNFLFRYRNGLFPLAYLLLFAKDRLVTVHYEAAALAGFAIALTGQALRAATIGLDYIIRGGKNRQVYAERLVTGGLFAHCRNPLYVGNFLVLVGLGVASCSAVFLFGVIPFFIFAYAAIISAEEVFLRNKFGAEFDAYCARVNRLVPNFSGLSATLNGMGYNWRRLITAEYGATAAWLTGMILVTLHNVWLAGDFERRRPLVIFLGALLVAVGLAYCVARFLKKTGRLASPARFAQP